MNPCLHLEWRLMYSGASNGIGVWCPQCERWATVDLKYHTSWALPKNHALLDGKNRAEIGRVHAVSVACEICRIETQTPEMHHWCPRALYRDNPPPDAGPQAWLCKPCHATWHEVVTPGLKGGMTVEGATTFLRALYKRMTRAQWDAFVRTVNNADERVRRMPVRKEAA
jgi:transposase-like protein